MNNLYKVCANTLWLRGDETLTKDNFTNIIAIQNELIATLQEKNRDLEHDIIMLEARNQELEKIYDEWVGYQLAEH